MQAQPECTGERAKNHNHFLCIVHTHAACWGCWLLIERRCAVSCGCGHVITLYCMLGANCIRVDDSVWVYALSVKL